MTIHKFIMKKIWNKKWLNSCLLLGIALLIATFVCHPLLLTGANNRLLKTAFENEIKESDSYNANVLYDAYIKAGNQNTQSIKKIICEKTKYIESVLDLKSISQQSIITLDIGSSKCYFSGKNNNLKVAFVPNLYEHISITDGNSIYNQISTDEIKSCMVSENIMDKYSLVCGEIISYPYLISKTDAEDENKGVTLTIEGIFNKKTSKDLFFQKDLSEFEDCVFVNESAFDSILEHYEISKIRITQNISFNYKDFQSENASDILNQSRRVDSEYYEFEFLNILEQYKMDSITVGRILYALELPCVVLLIVFIFMVISKLVSSEQGEIAILKRRGLGKKQIYGIYVIQVLILYGLGIIIGIPFGILICKVFGNVGYSFEIILYSLIPVLLVISTLTIVLFVKIKKNMRASIMVNGILVALSIYLLLNYKNNSNHMSLDILNGNAIDPMILLDGSIFVFASGILCVRFFKIIVHVLYRLLENRIKADTYMALLHYLRSFEKYMLISVFIIMTLANGIYTSNMAGTIKENIERRAEYNVGTDLVITQDFKYSAYTEPKSKKYIWSYKDRDYYITYASTYTRVIEENTATIFANGNNYQNCRFMAITPKEFGNTARLEEGINEEHWYYALNALAGKKNGVIISDNLANVANLSVGDTVNLNRIINPGKEVELPAIELEIVYIVKGFPGYERYDYTRDKNEKIFLDEKYLAVCNYAYIVSEHSMTPYNIWIKTDDYKKTLKSADYSSYIAMDAEKEELSNSPVINITNAMFRICFLISIIICFIGMLIFWVISMRERTIQFGVMRAMGMSENEIIKMFRKELMISNLCPIFSGVVAGFLGTKLFAKLISICYLPEKHIISIDICYALQESTELVLCMIAVLLLCLFIFRKIMKKLNITKALNYSMKLNHSSSNGS